MDRKTYNLARKVLKRFDKAGILNSVLLIGSWSAYFYKYYFKNKEYSAYLRTRDMDFLVPTPLRFEGRINILKLIEDLGFIEDFKGEKGYIQLVHPDITLEFLVPERGRGSDRPHSLPQWGINAQPLRYLDFLADNSVAIKAEGLTLRLPHPAAYVLHKFIVFKRRGKIEKLNKDLEEARRIFHALLENKEQNSLQAIFKTMHSKWQKTVIKNLKSVKEFEIVDILIPQ